MLRWKERQKRTYGRTGGSRRSETGSTAACSLTSFGSRFHPRPLVFPPLVIPSFAESTAPIHGSFFVRLCKRSFIIIIIIVVIIIMMIIIVAATILRFLDISRPSVERRSRDVTPRTCT